MEVARSRALRMPGLTRRERHLFEQTVGVFRSYVERLVPIVDALWPQIEAIQETPQDPKAKRDFVDHLTHGTSRRAAVFPEFDRLFPGFPSYLRRSAVQQALQVVGSYRGNHERWEASGRKGGEPRLTAACDGFPCLFRTNMFVWEEGIESALVKVWDGKQWAWREVAFKASDVWKLMQDKANCGGSVSAPTLVKRRGRWELRVTLTSHVKLPDKPAKDVLALAVDLGTNHAATAVALGPSGSVVARRFLRLGADKDRASRALDAKRRQSKGGARRTRREWERVDGLNEHVEVETARWVRDTALELGCDMVVFEHLDKDGWATGSERTHLWRCCGVQGRCQTMLHAVGIRVSTVNARRSSQLAFDGSGEVVRGVGKRVWKGRLYDNEKLVRFGTGKVYDADLNAAQNIGARYFCRELLRPYKEAETKKGREQYEAVRAKVPDAVKRTGCTLATLRNLDAVLGSL